MSTVGVPSRRSNGCERWRHSGLPTMDGSIDPHPDFSVFIASLNARDLRYMVVGGYAVAAHGHPRYTGDRDL